MVVVARPDLIGALIARLRSFPEITVLTGTRISGELQDAWQMPTHAIRVRRTGGPRPDVQANRWRSRVDVTCYGSTGYEASRLMDIVAPALAPDQMTRSSFVQGTVRVFDVIAETDAFSDVEPDTGWPFCWMPFVINWSGLPA